MKAYRSVWVSSLWLAASPKKEVQALEVHASQVSRPSLWRRLLRRPTPAS
jgi:hypothetical protein